MKQYILMILFVVFVTLGLFAQQKTVKGQVVDTNSNRPIYEASIQVKGTTNFTTTDRDGKFELNLNDKDVLEIQHLSYNTKEVLVVLDPIILEYYSTFHNNLLCNFFIPHNEVFILVPFFHRSNLS